MKNLAFVLVLLVALGSCRSTELIGSWKREEAPTKSYNDVGVIVMTPNMSSRSIIEVDVATILAQKGIKASATFDIFPFVTNRELVDGMDEEERRQHAKERLDKFGFDAILMVALLDQESVTRYNQGSSFSFAVPAYQYNYYGYYQYAYATVSTPGYYTTTKTYFLESNLYDIETEALLWTAQTKTKRNSSSIHKESQVFANIIVQEMLKKEALVP